MPDVHSIFPPSSAERHLNCIPSLLLEAQCPSTTNDAAEEGTYAHWVAENKLLKQLGLATNDEEPEYKGWDKAEIDEYTDAYLAFINMEAEILETRDGEAPVIIPERQVSFDNWVPGGFGTSDCIIISKSTISIVDLKYGRTFVDYKNNTQLKIYALGAVQEFLCMCPDCENIRISIFQPRVDNCGTYELTLKELLAWAEDFVKPRAAKALKGDGEVVAGPWCKYCKAKVLCPLMTGKSEELIEKAKELSKEDIKNGLMADEDIEKILPELDYLADWIKSVKEYALGKALEGKEWSGMKIGSGRSSRNYKNEEQVKAKIKELGVEDKAYQTSLLSVAQLEKALGKKTFTENFKDLIESTPGNPTLVPKKE